MVTRRILIRDGHGRPDESVRTALLGKTSRLVERIPSVDETTTTAVWEVDWDEALHEAEAAAQLQSRNSEDALKKHRQPWSWLKLQDMWPFMLGAIWVMLKNPVAAERLWNDFEPSVALEEAGRILRQAVYDRNVIAKGIPAGRVRADKMLPIDAHVGIPFDIWDGLALGSGVASQSAHEIGNADNIRFYDVQVVAAGVMRTWPPIQLQAARRGRRRGSLLAPYDGPLLDQAEERISAGEQQGKVLGELALQARGNGNEDSKQRRLREGLTARRRGE